MPDSEVTMSAMASQITGTKWQVTQEIFPFDDVITDELMLTVPKEICIVYGSINCVCVFILAYQPNPYFVFLYWFIDHQISTLMALRIANILQAGGKIAWHIGYIVEISLV